MLTLSGQFVDGRKVQLRLADTSFESIKGIRNAEILPLASSSDQRLARRFMTILGRAAQQNRVYAKVLQNDIDFVGLIAAKMKTVVRALREIHASGCSVPAPSVGE